MSFARPLNQDRRRKPRIRVEIEVKVKVRLFGSNVAYEFVSDNVSESGLLLTLKSGSLHFNNASILELTLYPDAKSETQKDAQIFCVARYVRQANDKSIGVKIIEIDDVNMKKLQSLLELAGGKTPGT